MDEIAKLKLGEFRFIENIQLVINILILFYRQVNTFYFHCLQC